MEIGIPKLTKMKKRSIRNFARKYFSGLFISQLTLALLFVPLLYNLFVLKAKARKSPPVMFHKTEIKLKEINNTIVLKYKIADNDDDTENRQMSNLFFPVI